MSETTAELDVGSIRRQFPILAEQAGGKPLVYLDNGASTQKPLAVIEAVDRYFRSQNANIHRAVHRLSQTATDLYEGARVAVQRFINAPRLEEVIFTRGTTEAINLVASSFTKIACREGDEILVSTLEHHSNIVPWQLACERLGLRLRVIPIDDRGEILYDQIPALLSDRTKLVAITHTSNALGTIIDVKRITEMAHRAGAKVLVDGAQWIAHAPTDVQAIGCDFYVFSGHKLFAPTGVGVLWGRRELLDAMPPFLGGGDMIRTVSFEMTTYAGLPAKFEAGTPPIAEVVGLGAAIEWLSQFSWMAIAKHEHDLLDHATRSLREIPGLRIVGTAPCKAGIVSFVMDEPRIDHHTIGTLLDVEGIAVRTGHHCCMPLMDRLNIPGTTRASMSLYNDHADIDRFVVALKKIVNNFARPTSPTWADQKVDREIKQIIHDHPLPQQIAQQLVEDFELFDDWEQKHEYLIDLGRKLRPLPASERTEPNRVHGCQSTVFLSARKREGTKDILDFDAESDAFVVNGLIYLLHAVFAGQPAQRILDFNEAEFFQKLGLSAHLSMGRRNGLDSMVRRVKSLAKLLLDSSQARAGA